ncbi:hypothetical protein WJX72_008577 [[Myrmecia] bisecta]|uniref:Disease resistance R13L4/SHOC-2-like LRR domain-containing protein n=1 Tax=[Myrmecia] bisecta TaxID=41462 RepID=A0AAW1Q7U4_9CHLO
MSVAIRKCIAAGRSTGTINLDGKGLQEVPTALFDPEEVIPGTEPVKWWEVAALTRVVLSHNQLAQLTAAVALAEHLTVLDLSHNQLTSLPEELGTLAALKLLDVSNNRLQQLPDCIAGLPSLVRLACTCNTLGALPAQLGEQQRALAELAACDNALHDLPEGLSMCSSLSVLHVEGNSLSSLQPRVLQGLLSLRDFNIARNRLSGQLSADVGALAKLEILNLKENKLTALPASLARCTNLVELHAGFNALASLPGEIGMLSKLRVLDVRNNLLRSLPAAMCTLSLSLLDLQNNALARSVFGAGETEVAREEAQKLSLAAQGSGSQAAPLLLKGMGLTEVPAEAWQAASALGKLDLSDNRIQRLSVDQLACCTRLTVLLLHDNPLLHWPLPGIPGLLGRLAELSLARTAMPAIPADPFACCAASLQSLDLSGCLAVRQLPSGSLAKLQVLQHLKLASAQLTHLPADVPTLTTLRTLDISNNQIAEVPERVTQLTRLEQLNLCNNDVAGLPARMGLMVDHLRVLQLDGCRIRSIRRPILDRGTRAVLEYLRDRIPA